MFLGTIAFLLILANIGVNLIKLFTEDRSFHGIIPMFELKSEKNIPTFFNGSLFLINAVFLVLVWYGRRAISKMQHIWLFLAALFVFLAFDEQFQVHELLIEPLRQSLNTSGAFYFAWVIVYGGAVLALGAVFFPVWWQLDRTIKIWLFAAAAVFLLGAIGLEMVGGAYYEQEVVKGGIIYAAMYTTEESLELAGLIIFTYSLLLLIGKTMGGMTLTIPGNELVPLPVEVKQQTLAPSPSLVTDNLARNIA